jgi:hypothetical protein
MAFTEEENKGKIRGAQSWKTCASESGSTPLFKQDNDVYFWLPTHQYFIAFPLRIQETNAFALRRSANH